MSSILSLLGFLLPLLVEWWQAAQAKKVSYDHDTTAFDQALAAGRPDDLTAAFERVRSDAIQSGAYRPGGPGDRQAP